MALTSGTSDEVVLPKYRAPLLPRGAKAAPPKVVTETLFSVVGFDCCLDVAEGSRLLIARVYPEPEYVVGRVLLAVSPSSSADIGATLNGGECLAKVAAYGTSTASFICSRLPTWYIAAFSMAYVFEGDCCW